MHIIIYFLTKISIIFFIPSELREEQNFIRENLPNIFYLKKSCDLLNFSQGEDLQHILHSIQDMFF